MDFPELNEYLLCYADNAMFTMRCRSDSDAIKIIAYANELSTGDDPYRIISANNKYTLTNVMPS